MFLSWNKAQMPLNSDAVHQWFALIFQSCWWLASVLPFSTQTHILGKTVNLKLFWPPLPISLLGDIQILVSVRFELLSEALTGFLIFVHRLLHATTQRSLYQLQPCEKWMSPLYSLSEAYRHTTNQLQVSANPLLPFWTYYYYYYYHLFVLKIIRTVVQLFISVDKSTQIIQ